MSPMTELVDELLRSLGDTADEVADSLRRRQITGARSDGCLCPIANLIRTEIPEASNDEDWSVDGYWFADTTFVKTPDGTALSPAPVRAFISTFDDGENGSFPYADLDDMNEVDE